MGYLTLFFSLFLLLYSCSPKSDVESSWVGIPAGTHVFENGAVIPVPAFEVYRYEVTNDEFARFVSETGYITTAEREGWSYVFDPADSLPGAKMPHSPWWKAVRGASWKNPLGLPFPPGQDPRLPVTHVSHEDAQAYCRWVGGRLPTEAEWEYMALLNGEVNPKNVWQGVFPDKNLSDDGFYGPAPVGSFKPGKLGLYDVQGNVWEWCADLYHAGWYDVVSDFPDSLRYKGPPKGYDPETPYQETRVIRGGSFLCEENFCAGYNLIRRMRTPPHQSFSHIGFRCVR